MLCLVHREHERGNIFAVTSLFPLPGQEVHFEVPGAPDSCTVLDSELVPPEPGNNPGRAVVLGDPAPSLCLH